MDELFRSKQPSNASDDKAQATHILVAAIDAKAGDNARAYLSELVASATGLSNTDADQRVDTVIGQAKSDAETARKVAARVSLYTFFSMLIGAFIASTAAAIGGKQRDL